MRKLLVVVILSEIGHPTCMDLGTVATLVRSYLWKCVECKTCEICQEKGDDVCAQSFSKFAFAYDFYERTVFSFATLATEVGIWTV